MWMGWTHMRRHCEANQYMCLNICLVYKHMCKVVAGKVVAPMSPLVKAEEERLAAQRAEENRKSAEAARAAVEAEGEREAALAAITLL